MDIIARIKAIKSEFFKDRKMFKQLTAHKNLRVIVLLVLAVVAYICEEHLGEQVHSLGLEDLFLKDSYNSIDPVFLDAMTATPRA